MKAVVEVSWLLAAIPGAEMIDDKLVLRNGSVIPVTILYRDKILYRDDINRGWHADGGWAEPIGE